VDLPHPAPIASPPPDHPGGHPAPERTSWTLLLAYALPSLPLAALTLPTYVFLPTFYAETLGLGVSSVGFVLLVARFWDVLVDPLIGVVSDLTSSRFGRRKPWIVLGAPLVTIAMWLLFVPAEGVGVVHLVVWSIVLNTGWIMMIIPMTALGAELAEEYHERSRVAGWREGVTVLGTVVALGLPYALGHADAKQPGPALEVMAVTCAILIPLTVLGLALRVPDAPVTFRRTAAAAARAAPWRRVGSGVAAFVRGLAPVLRNQPFRVLISAYLLNGIANSLPATVFLLYVGYVLDAPAEAGAFLFAYFVSGVVTAPVWVVLSRHIGKHRAWMVGLGWASAVFVWTPFVGAGDTLLFTLIVIGSGMALGADLILPSAMQADVIDVDTFETNEADGRGRAGLFFALWGTATKLALALALLSFPLLGLAGFADRADEMPHSARVMLIVIYGVLPVVFKMCAFLLMLRYPLTAERQAELRRGIARQARSEAPVRTSA
jgi:Na+/melibiose symporter-like transporter